MGDIKHPMLDSALTWARGQQSIRALVLTGSLARGDGESDAFSDLDLQVIADDCRAYIADDCWLDELGDVWIRFPLSADSPYKLVIFAGGVKVDFQFLTIADVRGMAASGHLSDEYLRGYVPLLDKDDLFACLPASPRIFPQPPKPSADQLRACSNEFWFEAIQVAQCIRRRELWLAKHRDWTMKRDLLQMLEWLARARSPLPVNTWLLGKGIAEWCEPAALAAISRIFGAWDAASAWSSLLEQMALFGRVSGQLAAILGMERDVATTRQIEAYIRDLRAQDPLD